MGESAREREGHLQSDLAKVWCHNHGIDDVKNDDVSDGSTTVYDAGSHCWNHTQLALVARARLYLPQINLVPVINVICLNALIAARAQCYM